jgi:hypothetical protein
LPERVGFGMERSVDSIQGGSMTWRRMDDMIQSGDDEVSWSRKNWMSGIYDQRRTSWWGMVVVGK